MRLSDLAALQLTYRDVGATAGPLPDGYHHVRKSAVIGRGRPRFEDAAAKVMRWGMLRGAGVRVEASSEVAAVGSEVLVGLGPLRAPCRVVYVIDETDRRGFAYGTLPGHPESGEELFSVRYDPGPTRCTPRSSPSPGTGRGGVRLGSPVTSLAQRIITERYLTAL